MQEPLRGERRRACAFPEWVEPAYLRLKRLEGRDLFIRL
jgi:hypothetical protein